MNLSELLLKLQHDLGYTHDTNGSCFGFAVCWLEACFIHNEKRMLSLLNDMVINDKHVVTYVELAKVKKGLALTEDDNKYLEINEYLKSLNIYQTASLQQDLFKRYCNQLDLELVSKYACRSEIAQLGGLTTLYTDPFIYSKTEIENYFDCLRYLQIIKLILHYVISRIFIIM